MEGRRYGAPIPPPQVCQTERRGCAASPCPAKGVPVVTEATLLPSVLVLGVVWPQARVPQDDLIRFLAHVGTTFAVADLFDGSPGAMRARLTGLVLYYARHYLALFWHTPSAEWLLFDDGRVRPLGTEWLAVLRYLVQGHLQPLLLFYSLDAAPTPQNGARVGGSAHNAEDKAGEVDQEVCGRCGRMSAWPAQESHGTSSKFDMSNKCKI